MVYHAIAYDPLTAAVLSLAEIKQMVNEMLAQKPRLFAHVQALCGLSAAVTPIRLQAASGSICHQRQPAPHRQGLCPWVCQA